MRAAAPSFLCHSGVSWPVYIPQYLNRSATMWLVSSPLRTPFWESGRAVVNARERAAWRVELVLRMVRVVRRGRGGGRGGGVEGGGERADVVGGEVLEGGLGSDAPFVFLVGVFVLVVGGGVAGAGPEGRRVARLEVERVGQQGVLQGAFLGRA